MADRDGGWTGQPTIYGKIITRDSIANDNSERTSFTNPSSGGRARRPANPADAPKRKSAARKLRPTDLFDDLAEDADALRAAVPLCATRGKVRID
jgi:hypothetical protein